MSVQERAKKDKELFDAFDKQANESPDEQIEITEDVLSAMVNLARFASDLLESIDVVVKNKKAVITDESKDWCIISGQALDAMNELADNVAKINPVLTSNVKSLLMH